VEEKRTLAKRKRRGKGNSFKGQIHEPRIDKTINPLLAKRGSLKKGGERGRKKR